MIDFAALVAPFAPDRVSWRVGSTTKDKSKGMALAYIDARDVYERLDAVCTPGGWQCRYTHADKKTVCEIGIKVGDEWVWKANGAGDSDIEAEKGALSDAVKRAAVVWGIGRYLYDLDSPWVELEEKGSTRVIKPSERPKLLRVLTGNHAPAEATSARSSSPPSSISQKATAARRTPQAAPSLTPPLPDKDGMLDAINRSGSMKQLSDLIAKPRWAEAMAALFPPDRDSVENAVADKQAILSDIRETA